MKCDKLREIGNKGLLRNVLIPEGTRLNKRHNKFTLVELLVVICIASLLLGLVLPAFNRMVTGSAVDRLASNLKLRLERAQSHAASSRRHVAVILPHGDTGKWTQTQEQAARLGGSRMCYVDYADYTGTFEGWIEEEWNEAERGAFLIRAFKDTSSLTSGSALGTAGGSGMDSIIVAAGGDADSKPLKDITLPSSRTLTESAIIFSPQGKICSSADVYLVIAEGQVNNNAIFYPGGNGSGSYNWTALKINRFTGKVEYYRP